MKFLLSTLLLLSLNLCIAQDSSSIQQPIDSLKSEAIPVKKDTRTIKDFFKFIGDNFRTPENMNFVGGKMIVEFFVLRDGSLVDIKVIKDLGFGSSTEIIRVIKKYGKWTPSDKPNGPERVKYTMPFVIKTAY